MWLIFYFFNWSVKKKKEGKNLLTRQKYCKSQLPNTYLYGCTHFHLLLSYNWVILLQLHKWHKLYVVCMSTRVLCWYKNKEWKAETCSGSVMLFSVNILYKMVTGPVLVILVLCKGTLTNNIRNNSPPHLLTAVNSHREVCPTQDPQSCWAKARALFSMCTNQYTFIHFKWDVHTLSKEYKLNMSLLLLNQ